MSSTQRSFAMPILYAIMIAGAGLLSYYIYTAKVDNPSDNAAFSANAKNIGDVAILTSLPLFSPEVANISNALGLSDNQDAMPHPLGAYWTKTLAPSIYDDPVSAMSDDPDLLILAQSRPFTPEQLAQFDKWVRSGGNALVFADPASFWPSIFSIGDRRRPEGATLLSPLFAHWGLEQYIDDDQPEGPWSLVDQSIEMTVIQSGYFLLTGNGDARCTLYYGDAVAACNIGKGRAVLVADADMLQAQFYGIEKTADTAGLSRIGNWRSVTALLQLAVE